MMNLLGSARRKTNDLNDVEVLGLVPTKAFCYYTLYKQLKTGIQKFYFPVDAVPRSTSTLSATNDPVPVVDVISLVTRAEYDEKVNKLETEISTLKSLIKTQQTVVPTP